MPHPWGMVTSKFDRVKLTGRGAERAPGSTHIGAANYRCRWSEMLCATRDLAPCDRRRPPPAVATSLGPRSPSERAKLSRCRGRVKRGLPDNAPRPQEGTHPLWKTTGRLRESADTLWQARRSLFGAAGKPLEAANTLLEPADRPFSEADTR